MKNQNSKSKVTKRKLSKCKDVCRTYNDIQYAYCDYLQADNSIIEFQCNVILSDFSVEGTYSTDFVCIKANGDVMVRECVPRDKLSKPLNIKLLDASRAYWLRRGVTDWGLVVNVEN